jgi:hypothetical protein
MATHSGSEGKIFVETNQIAEIKSWSLEVTADTVDASTIGTEWRKNHATIKSWAGSFEAFWDETDEAQGKLGAGKTVTLNLYPEGDEEGNTYFTGNVIITSIAYKASFDGLVEAGFSFSGTGALTQAIVKRIELIETIKPKPKPTIPVEPITTESVKPTTEVIKDDKEIKPTTPDSITSTKTITPEEEKKT